MEIGTVLRILAAGIAAILGLVLAAWGDFRISLAPDTLGFLLFLAGLFVAYRAVKAHFDTKDGA